MIRWTNMFQRSVTGLFEKALGATDTAVHDECRRQLLELGLSEDQIENGFTAGVMEMARLLGRSDVIEAIRTDKARPRKI